MTLRPSLRKGELDPMHLIKKKKKKLMQFVGDPTLKKEGLESS